MAEPSHPPSEGSDNRAERKTKGRRQADSPELHSLPADIQAEILRVLDAPADVREETLSDISDKHPEVGHAIRETG